MSTAAITAKRSLAFWRQIRWNLAFYFVVLAIIPVAVVSIYNFVQARDEAIETTTNDLEAIAELKQEQIDLWLNGTQSSLAFITRADPVVGVVTNEEVTFEDQDEASAVLLDAVTDNPNFQELFVYNMRGQVVASSNEDERGKVLTLQPYFDPSLQDDQRSYFQPPYFDLRTNELTVIVTTQLFDQEGQLSGAVAGRVNIEILSNILADRVGLGDTGETYLVSLENNYLLTPSRFEGYEQTRKYETEGINSVLAGDDGSGRYNNYQEPSVPVIGAYRWMPNLQVGLIAERYEEEALDAAIDARNTAIAISAIAALLTAAAGFYIASRISRPITSLTATAQQLAEGDLDQRAQVEGRNEVGILSDTFNSMAAQIQNIVGSLEQRVAERTKDLATTLEVGRLATTLATREDFYDRMVNYIRDSFDLYYTQIYLLDEGKRFAILRSGTGEVGQQLVERNHRLDMDATSIVARSVQNNSPVLVSNTERSDVFLPNPLLPNTRSEVAIPLSVGGNVLGILDMQAAEGGTFNEANLPLFESMANQLAGVIQSNKAFEETRAAIERADEINRRMTRENWEGYLSRVGQGQKVGYRYNLETPTPLDEWTTLPEVIVEEPTQSHSVQPIRLGSQNIGNILVSEDGERQWSYDELALIEDVAERVAQAVEQLRAFDETETRARELATVADVSTQAATTLNTQDLLLSVAELTKDRFNLYHAHIYLIDDKGENLVLAAGAGEAGQQMVANGHSIALKRENSIVARAARTRQGIIANDITTAPDFLPNPLLPDTKSEMAIPMIVGGELVGVLDTQANTFNRFTEEDIRVKTTLAEQLAVALSNARQYERTVAALAETEIQARSLALLNELSSELTSANTSDEIFETAAPKISKIFGAVRASIAMLNENDNTLEIFALKGESGAVPLGMTLPVQGTSIGITVRERRIVNTPDAQQSDLKDVQGLAKQGIRSAISAPLIASGRVIGTANLASETINAFSQRDENILQQAASLLAATLENQRLFDQTQKALSQTATLYETGQSIAAANTVDEILEAIVRAAPEYLDTININLFDDPIVGENQATGMIETVASWRTSGDDSLNGYRYSTTEFPVAEWIVSHDLVVNNIETDERIDDTSRQDLLRLGIRSFVGSVMQLGERQLGFILFGSAVEQDHDETEVRFLRALTDQAVTAIDSLRSFDAVVKARLEVERVYNSSIDLIGSANFDGYFVNLNPAWETTLGYAPEELMERPFIEFVHPDDVEHTNAEAGRTTEGVESFSFENRFRRKDGDFVWFSWNAAPDMESGLIHFVTRDVTAQKQQEEQIRSAREEAEILFQVGRLVNDAENEQDIIDAIVQYAIWDEVNGVSLTQSDNPENQGAGNTLLTADWRRDGTSLKGMVIPADEYAYAVDLDPHEIFRSDDVTTDPRIDERSRQGFNALGIVGIMYAPMMIGNQTLGTLALTTDQPYSFTDRDERILSSITDQATTVVQRLNLTRQTEKRATELQVVAEVSAAAATILDQRQLLDTFTNLTRDSFGLYHAHVYLPNENGDTLILRSGAGDVGNMMVEAGHRISFNQQHSIVARAGRTGEVVISNDVSQEPDFLPNPMLPNTKSEMALPIIAGDMVIGVLDVQADTLDYFTADDAQILTTLARQLSVALSNAELYEEQLETAERLREVDRLKSEFLASMSHELRTPLNSIIGYAEVMLDGLDGPLNEEMEEDISAIHGSGKLLLNLINDILDLAKIEAGQMELEYEPVNPVEFMQEMIRSSVILVKDKPVDMLVSIDDTMKGAIPEEIQADPIRLRQIVNNLLSNAAKFTEEGSITINLEVENGHLITAVTDTGVGMNPEQLDLIFERFRQVDQSSTRRHQGTGLGLDITRRLVHMHGGQIWVESEPSKGSRFIFSLPIQREGLETAQHSVTEA